MKDSNKYYKDGPWQNRAPGRRGLILGISDSFVVGLSFYFGFLLTHLWSHSMPYIHPAELVMMGLGAAFSYAFVFVFRRSHQTTVFSFSKVQALGLLGNLSYAYLLHLSILFLIKDTGFSSVRNAVGLGYLLAFLGISVNRLLISLGSTKVREGKKRIVFKGMGIPVPSGSQAPPTYQVSGQGEFRISQNTPPDEIIRCLERIRGHSFKIVVDDAAVEFPSDPAHIAH